MAKTPTHQCEARIKNFATHDTASANHREFRCKRPAITKVNGHWACKQHAKKKPPNGWM
jgi:hypothetical protein